MPSTAASASPTVKRTARPGDLATGYLRGLNITGLEGNNFDSTLAFGTTEPAQFANAQATYDNAADRGHRLARIPFLWERVQPTVGGPLSRTSLDMLKAEVAKAADAGLVVVLDLKNYGQRFDAPGGASVKLGVGALTPAAFADLWSRIARAFANQPAVIGWGLMNEPHDLPVPSSGTGSEPTVENSTWKIHSQAATDAIRATGDTRDVYVAGDQWSGAWDWTRTNGDPWIVDPAGAVVYEAHLYLDSLRSGVYEGTFAQEEALDIANGWPSLLARVTADAGNVIGWAQTHDVRIFIGEFGFPYDEPEWIPVAEAAYAIFNDARVPVTAWGTGRNLTGPGPGGSYDQDPYPLGLDYEPQAQATVYEDPANLSKPSP